MSANLLNVADAADKLHMSIRAVQHRIRNGQIKAAKLGAGRTSAYVITGDEIDRVLAEERRKAQERVAALDSAAS